jgi:hypothetical protein
MRCKEVRRKSVLGFRHSIRALTPRLKTQKPVTARSLRARRLEHNRQLDACIRRVNVFLCSWHGYFKTMRSRYGPRAWKSFDAYVRGRLRATLTGRVGRGWWDVVVPNALFRQLGLVSLLELDALYRTGLCAAPTRKG